MRQFLLYSAFISAIFAAPAGIKRGYLDLHDYEMQQLGVCDASSLPAYVIESLGMDPTEKYELNDDFMAPFSKACGKLDLFGAFDNLSDSNTTTYRKRIDEARASLSFNPELAHSMDVLFVINLKVGRSTGHLGVMICDLAITEVEMCKKTGDCSFNYSKLNSLKSMSPEEREEKFEQLESILKETRSKLDELQYASGNTLLNVKLNTEHNRVVAEILHVAAVPSTEWMMKKCMTPLMTKSQELYEEYCKETLGH